MVTNSMGAQASDDRSGASGLRPLILALALWGCWSGTACGDQTPELERSDSPPDGDLSVLLVTLDTTRADALSCYSSSDPGSGEFAAKEGATPCLDGLAARGLRFSNATTVAPLTLPAHASMLTGQIPPVHGIRENGLWGLPPDALSVAEEAQAAGLRTAAFIAAVVLDSSYGLDQGFEVYDQPARSKQESSSHYVDRPANQVIDAAIAWLDGIDRDEQVFQWVHLFDPHQPYAPPTSTPDSGASQHDLYQAEVSYMDGQLARLIDRLEASGRMDQTLVIICADHGESLGEHGEWSHAALCFEATLHVPFLLVFPNGYRAGEVSDATVSVVDVAATAREAMGLAADGEGAAFEDGLSLFGRSVPADRRVYFESYSGNLSFGWAPIVGQRSGRWKTLLSSRAQVFDVLLDPNEEHDLSGDEAARLDGDRAWLVDTLARAERRARGAKSAGSTQAAEDLAALGYTTAAAGISELPDPFSSGHLPAPEDCTQEYQDTLRASALQNEGHHEEAQRLAHRVVVQNSGNIVALQTWTAALLSLQRYGEAIPGLQRLVARRPLTAGFQYNLGVALARSGQEDAGIEALWRSVELDYKHEAYLAELQQLLRSLGRREEFEAYGKRWQALQTADQVQPPR